MSLHDEAQRGAQAADVLANPAYSEAYGLIEQEIINKWRESTDQETRERLHLSLKLLAMLHKALDSTMKSGQVAARELEIQQSRLERIGAAFKRRSVA